jgi:NhaA family Na+:H+ antiporter
MSGEQASGHEVEHKDEGLFAWFFHSEISGGVVLLICTVVALALANSAWSDTYFHLLHTKIGLSWGDARFALSLQHWVNDALMVLFFFVVGLEIKREILVGQLSTVRKAILPVSAALGGMLVPAGIYVAFNAGGDGAAGWGIPMATDIAFALGVLALVGPRVPLGLKVFLTALAIADDMGAVLVIALFYTDQIMWAGLVAAAVLLGLLALVTGMRVRRAGFYLLLAVGVWAAVFVSGVHATVAGILVAMVVPVRALREPSVFLKESMAHLAALAKAGMTRESMVLNQGQLREIESLHKSAGDMRPPGIALEHYLHPVQAFFVLPIFALCNAGVDLSGGFLEVLFQPVSLGIIAGLFVGKQVGVWLFTWVAVKSGLADLPAGVNWAQIYAAGLLAGVGFTMSLFITDLGLSDPQLITEAKTAILVASLLSAVVGFVVLRLSSPPAPSLD